MEYIDNLHITDVPVASVLNSALEILANLLLSLKDVGNEFNRAFFICWKIKLPISDEHLAHSYFDRYEYSNPAGRCRKSAPSEEIKEIE